MAVARARGSLRAANGEGNAPIEKGSSVRRLVYGPSSVDRLAAAAGNRPRPRTGPRLRRSHFSAVAAAADPDAMASLDPTRPADPVTQEQLTLHFMSHINAECFISLLQTMDPLPYDGEARAEYRRFYGQLHEVLKVRLRTIDRSWPRIWTADGTIGAAREPSRNLGYGWPAGGASGGLCVRTNTVVATEEFG